MLEGTHLLRYMFLAAYATSHIHVQQFFFFFLMWLNNIILGKVKLKRSWSVVSPIAVRDLGVAPGGGPWGFGGPLLCLWRLLPCIVGLLADLLCW